MTMGSSEKNQWLSPIHTWTGATVSAGPANQEVVRKPAESV